MSLARKFISKAALSTALAFGAVSAPALAAGQCLPGAFNPSRGIQVGDCYSTPETNRAMAAFQQKTRIVGDRIAVADDATGQVITLSYHNRWTSSDDGKIGFNLEGDGATGSPQSKWIVGAVFKDVRVWDRNKREQPSAELVGRLHAQGIKKSGDLLMLSAKQGQGHYVVVARKDDPAVGSFLLANDKEGSGLAGLKNLDYAPGGREALASPAQHASAGETAPVPAPSLAYRQ